MVRVHLFKYVSRVKDGPRVVGQVMGLAEHMAKEKNLIDTDFANPESKIFFFQANCTYEDIALTQLNCD